MTFEEHASGIIWGPPGWSAIYTRDIIREEVEHRAALAAAGVTIPWPLRSPMATMLWPAPKIRTERGAAKADAPAIAQGSVVYYVQSENPIFVEEHGPIKIGHTTDLRRRETALAKDYGKVTVLAAEPGGRATEELRHWQFMETRLPQMLELTGGSEWFEWSPPLDQYIDYLLCKAHGHPLPVRMPLRGMGTAS